MPWCPNCKEEYTKGIVLCPDCNTELVESLEALKTKEAFLPVFTFETKELAEKFASYLSYSGIIALQNEDENNNVTISVRENEIKKAKKYFAAFYSVEASNALEREFEDIKEANDEVKEAYSKDYEDNHETTMQEELDDALSEIVYNSGTYEKRTDKATDALSTSITFLIFGSLGLLMILLSIFNLINFLGGPMFYILGTIIFVGFIAVGISSYKSYSKYKAEAIEEENLTQGLFSWLKENLTEDIINEVTEKLDKTDIAKYEDLKYFQLSSKIKQMITAQFGDIDSAYLDYIVEEYYTNNLTEMPEGEELP